jgi:hypothetical protein
MDSRCANIYCLVSRAIYPLTTGNKACPYAGPLSEVYDYNSSLRWELANERNRRVLGRMVHVHTGSCRRLACDLNCHLRRLPSRWQLADLLGLPTSDLSLTQRRSSARPTRSGRACQPHRRSRFRFVAVPT